VDRQGATSLRKSLRFLAAMFGSILSCLLMASSIRVR